MSMAIFDPRRLVRSLLAAACALLLVACRGAGDPYLEEYVTNRPPEAVITGVYFFKWQTAGQDVPTQVDLDDARLTLHADGTYTAVGLPIFRPTNDAFAFDKIVSAQGAWQLDARGAVADGDTFRAIWGVRFDGQIEYDFAYLTGPQNPQGLMFHAGAPTADAVVYFARE